ncbi:hypothetical protein [Butyrivibrio sp. XPD2002]|uniref:hypothetical protein n=1 Tax=Butyrivibrio sp. XPD2002 TaxID=1280665 RepID=UPI0003FB0966|nr:hypothetical protein [Butyrivibrio sp. XPD2002]
MSLEKSVRDIDKMSTILHDEYGLHLINNKNLALGSANCYKVHCKERALEALTRP